MSHSSNDKASDHSKDTEKTHTIKIGSRLATNSGYYYMVDDRPYIYTTYTTYLDYAFVEFTDFINPILISEGLAMDNAFEPYLTTDYQQYTNTVYKYDVEKEYYPIIPALSTTDGLSVIANTNTLTPNFSLVSDGSTVMVGGVSGVKDALTFNLGSNANVEDQKRLINFFVGKATGVYSTPISITLPVYSNTVDISKNINYKYVINSIDAILTDADDATAAGTKVASNDKIKVSYTLYKDGTKASDKDLCGVIDLGSDLVPSEVKTALTGKEVGALSSDAVTFERTYTETNSVVRTAKIVIERILSITVAGDPTEVHETVQEGDDVKVSYHYEVDGIRLPTQEMGIIIGDDKNGSEELDKALTGKKVGNYEDGEISVNAYTMNSEIIASFTSYEIDEIKYFVTKEKIVSFKFQQASERDP